MSKDAYFLVENASSRKHSKISIEIKLKILPDHFIILMERDDQARRVVTVLAGVIDHAI